MYVYVYICICTVINALNYAASLKTMTVLNIIDVGDKKKRCVISRCFFFCVWDGQ